MRIVVNIFVAFISSHGRAHGGELHRFCGVELLAERYMAKVIRQLLVALAFLHDEDLVHLDLKVSVDAPFLRAVLYYVMYNRAWFSRRPKTAVEHLAQRQRSGVGQR